MSTDRKLEFLSNLYEALTDRPHDPVQLRKSLEERGIDVEATLSKARDVVDQHRKARRLREAREKLARVQSALRRWTTEGRQSATAARDDIARALAEDAGVPAYQAYHRKLEEVSDEGLASLGDDAELLEFLERMEDDTE